MDIQHIFCVGRNFAKHAKEMGSETPTSPMIFSKPSYALVRTDDNVITYPNNRGAIHYEMEIVLRVGKPVKSGFAIEDIVTDMALGLDMTLRDVQSELKQKGHPWLIAKGFPHAAVVTDFWKFPGVDACREVDFSLYKNNTRVQRGNIKDLIFDFQTLLTYIHENVGLGMGDIIFTGTPEGVGPIASGDTFELHWGDEAKGQFHVRLN